MPQQMALETTHTKTPNRNITVKAWGAWIERGRQSLGTEIYGEKSFESITDSQRIVTPNSIIHPYRLSYVFMSWMSLQTIAGMDSWNKHVEQISLRPSSHLSEHGQLKGWPPRFEPTVAKNSISTIVYWFVAFVTWKHGAGIGWCHNKWPWRPHTPKHQIETSLWRHEALGSSEDGKVWVQKIYGEKSFESITDSQLKHRPWRCSSWIVTPNSIIHPFRLSDLFMSWMSLQ